MKHCKHWPRAVAAAALALAMVPGLSSGFPENTDTQGELPVDLNGVWLMVSRIEFPRPTPTATPEATEPAADAAATGEAAPAATPGGEAVPAASATAAPGDGASPATGEANKDQPAADEPERHFSVATLLKIVHLPKPDAQLVRDADARREQAAIEKAQAMIAEERKESIPLQTDTGEVEDTPKVLAPSVPPIRRPGDGDDVDIYLLDVEFPKTIQDSLDKAQKAQQAWEPSGKQLALLKSSWSDLKPSRRDDYSKIEWKVVSADKFDEGLQMDAATKDAKFAITANQDMIPKPGTPNQLILIYGAREIDDDVIAGGHVRAMMAAAPFPISIPMNGDFKMYKIVDLPKPKIAKPEDGSKDKNEAGEKKAEEDAVKDEAKKE